MSSDFRGDSSFFLSAVNVKELDRSTPDTVYLKHIISQWTQLQSKPHAVLHKESFGSRLAGCRDYRHHWPCSYWKSLMAISFVWISKWVINLQSNIHSEYVQPSWMNMSTCTWWHHGSDGTNFNSYIGSFQAKGSKKVGAHHTGEWPAGPPNQPNHILPHNFGRLLYTITKEKVMSLKCLPHNWPFVKGIHQSLVDFPHIGSSNATLVCLLCCWPGQAIEHKIKLKTYDFIMLINISTMWKLMYTRRRWNAEKPSATLDP